MFVIVARWRRTEVEEMALLPSHGEPFPAIKQQLMEWGLWRFFCPTCRKRIHQNNLDFKMRTAVCVECREKAIVEAIRCRRVAGFKNPTREVVTELASAEINASSVHLFDNLTTDVSDAEAVHMWRRKTQQLKELQGIFVGGGAVGMDASGLGLVEPKGVKTRDETASEKGLPNWFAPWVLTLFGNAGLQHDNVNNCFFATRERYDDAIRLKERIADISRRPARSYCWSSVCAVFGVLFLRKELKADVEHLEVLMFEQPEADEMSREFLYRE